MAERMLLPHKQCTGIDINGRELPVRDGFVTPRSASDARALRDAGAFTSSPPIAHPGRTCTSCGFATFFAKCGRCGGPAEPEVPHGHQDHRP